MCCAMANASQVMEFVALAGITVIQGGFAGHKIAVAASLAMLFVVLDACPRARPAAIHTETTAMPENSAF
jgi:hypothetical protein